MSAHSEGQAKASSDNWRPQHFLPDRKQLGRSERCFVELDRLRSVADRERGKMEVLGSGAFRGWPIQNSILAELRWSGLDIVSFGVGARGIQSTVGRTLLFRRCWISFAPFNFAIAKKLNIQVNGGTQECPPYT